MLHQLYQLGGLKKIVLFKNIKWLFIKNVIYEFSSKLRIYQFSDARPPGSVMFLCFFHKSSLLWLQCSSHIFVFIILYMMTRVGVKYSWPSTQVHQVPQIFTKYKYWSSTHFLKKYLSTSSTFISSTSTSTHIEIGFKVGMNIQSGVNFGWTKQKVFPQIMSLIKSQDGHILCRVNLEWTKYRGVISWSGYMASRYLSHHLKR